MITLLAASICFIALLVLYCTSLTASKTLIMSILVVAMLILTVVEELVPPTPPPQTLRATAEYFETRTLPSSYMLNVSEELFKNAPSRSLFKEERDLLEYLLEKQRERENFVTYIRNIESARFKAVFKEFQAQTKTPAVYVNYQLYNYSFADLQHALSQGRGFYNQFRERAVYFFIENVQRFDNIVALENIFLTNNVSYILQNVPPVLLEMSSLGKWAYRYQFEGSCMVV